MSRQIDERVVSMRFDNAKFEKNIETTKNSLDSLQNSLKFKDADKGFAKLEAASNGIDLSGLQDAVATISKRFSTLGIIAASVLNNITSAAISTGTRLVKSLSIDQVTTGWQKFGGKTTSVATLTAQGHALSEVNDQLSRLNWFTDETSYNFTDMVSNISKFTATGKGLSDSVTAMEGIATWAALSGQNAQTASHAMYQLSQAMAAGTMRYEDYRSIQNASMDTDEFRQKCLDAAVALGTIKKTSDDTYRSLQGSKKKFTKAQFATGLTEGAWLTSDVMMKVFNDYASAVDGIYDAADKKGMLASEVIDEIHDKAKKEGMSTDEAIKSLGYNFDGFALKAFEAAQKARTFGDAIDSVKDAVSTGWMNTFETVFGNSEEATELWTDLANAMYDVFAAGGEARNDMLKEWKDLGGRTDLIESFWNVWNGIASVVEPVKEAFRDVFPAMTAERLTKITKRLRELTEKFKLSEDSALKLKNAFGGIFSVVKIGWTYMRKFISAVITIVGYVGTLGSKLLSAASSAGEWLMRVKDSIKESNIFQRVLNGLIAVLQKVSDKIKALGSAIKNKLQSANLQTFADALIGLYNVAKKVAAAIVTAIVKIAKAFGTAFANGNIKSFLDLLNSGLLASILLKIKSIFKSFTQLKDAGSGMLQSIKTVFDQIGNTFTVWQKSINAGMIQKIAISVGILAASLWVLSGIDEDKLVNACGAITLLFGELLGAFKLYNKFGEELKGSRQAATLMIAMSLAVLILASAFKKISNIEWDGIGKGIVGLTAMMGALTGAIIAMSKFVDKSEKIFKIDKKGLFSSKSKTQFIAIGMAMIAMAAAVKILASACKDLGGMNWDELWRGITGLVIIMGALTGAMIALSKFTGASSQFSAVSEGIFSSKNKTQFISIGLAMIAMAAAMKILASAAKDFAAIGWEGLGKAGAAMTVILGLVVGFNKLCDYINGGSIGNAFSVLILGVAMEILANVCQKFGSMDWEALGKAGAAIGGILLIAVIFSKLASYSDGMFGAMASLVVMGVAMEILANVCQKFGSMDWEALGKAGAAIGGIMAIATAFILLSDLAKHSPLEAAGSLLMMAAALLILTPVLKTLGSMSWEGIVKSIVAIAAVFTIIGVAAALLGPIVPIILQLSGAIALFGVGCLAAGVGIAAFAAGLILLSTLTAASCTAIVAALYILIVGILEIIPAIVDALTDAIVALCQVIIQSVPAICEMIRVLVVELVKVLVDCLPVLVDGALKLVVYLLEALVEYTPDLVNGLVDFLVVLLEALGNRLGDLVKSLIDFVISLLEALGSQIGPIIEAAVNFVVDIIKGVADTIGPAIKQIISPILDLIVNIVQGFIDLISPYIKRIFDAMSKIAKFIGGILLKIFKMMSELVSKIISVVRDVIDAFKTLFKNLSSIIDSIGGVLQKLADAFTNTLKELHEIIKTFLDWTTDAFENIIAVVTECGEAFKKILSGVGEIIDKIFNGIASVVESIGISALNAGTGFDMLANGIKTITELSIADMAASLGAVALNLKKISANAKDIPKAATSIEKIADAIKQLLGASGLYNSAKNDGMNVAKGFAEGIRKSASAGSKAVSNMASSAVKIARSILQIKSPSRVFRAIGGYIVQGFANGIDDMSDLAIESVAGMSTRSVDATSKIISRIASMLDTDIDAQPTIRPVLDMSQIQAGADSINAMFGNSLIAVDTNFVNGVASDMTYRQNGSTNDDVVAAINSLRRELADAPRNSYNINGITYDDGTNVSNAIGELVRAARIERRT